MRTKPPVWLWAVPVLSCGLLAAVPPFVIALRLQTKRAWGWFGASAGASVLGLVLVGSQQEGAVNFWTNLGLLVVLGNLVGALTYSGLVGKGVLWGRGPAAVQAGPKGPYGMAPGHYGPVPLADRRPDPNAEAIAGVNAARQKRSSARSIAQRDPQMARDLRIGRPDLPRNFDDGGLVDLNSAPVSALVQWLGLSEAQAAQLVDVRHQLGRFMHPDDLMNVVGLDPRQYDSVRERVILL